MPITGINGIFLGDGAGGAGKVNLDIITGKVLQILASGTLGIASTALVENPGQVKAGTVIYRKTEIIKTGSYATKLDNGQGGITTQTPQITTIPVNLDKYVGAKYKLEEFDLAGLIDAAAIESQIANGLAKATLARLDLELFEGLKKFLVDNKATHTITLSTFSSENDIAAIRLNRIKFNDLIADIESTLNKEMIGTQEFQTTSVISKKAYNRLIEGIADNGGSRGVELRLTGQLPGQVVGGNAILKHVFITKNVDGNLYTLDKTNGTDYDFSKIEALLWNKEAVAMPVDFLGVVALRDQYDGNPIFIQKFRYGFKVLRGELIRGIVNDNAGFTRSIAVDEADKQRAKLETEAKKAIGKAFKREATPEEVAAYIQEKLQAK